MKLTANTTNTDKARCIRALLAWIGGDKYALDVLLEEVMDDPIGVPGLLFELLEFAVFLAQKTDPDIEERLRRMLLRLDQAS